MTKAASVRIEIDLTPSGWVGRLIIDGEIVSTTTPKARPADVMTWLAARAEDAAS